MRIAIFEKGSSKYSDSVMVFAARIGPSAVARMATRAITSRVISRFHKGQFCFEKVSAWTCQFSVKLYIQEDHWGRHLAAVSELWELGLMYRTSFRQ